MVPIILAQSMIRCRIEPECRGVHVLTAAKGNGYILYILHIFPTLFQDRKRAELRTCLYMVLFICDIFAVLFTVCTQ